MLRLRADSCALPSSFFLFLSLQDNSSNIKIGSGHLEDCLGVLDSLIANKTFAALKAS